MPAGEPGPADFVASPQGIENCGLFACSRGIVAGQAQAFVPLGDRFFRVKIELSVVGAYVRFDPGRLEGQHQVRMLRRDRQGGIDGGGERVDKVGPFRAVKP